MHCKRLVIGCETFANISPAQLLSVVVACQREGVVVSGTW
jgi:hypothetical protein